MRRAAPGPQLAVGRLRVDAARAIAKLREYQLADRTAWILEAIRAAVASGATEIELRGDSNDVWLWWSGTPLTTDDLPRLFDELVSPEPTHERHHVRLLAAAVNSALGMNPAYVDVFAIGTPTIRVRYTPDVLDEPETEDGTPGESALHKVVATPVPAPERSRPGTLVHLRRRASLEVLSYFLHGAEPPELALARAECRDLAVPIRIGDLVLDRHSHARDIVRVELGDGLDGWLALVDPATLDPSDRTAVMEVAERGVVLARYPIDLHLPEPRSPLPLRLFVDAARMPTNASRSQVRRESHPIAEAEARARSLVGKLVDQLVAKLAADPAEGTRAAALALLATAIAGADWRFEVENLRAPLRALAEAHLVRDATGALRPVATKWSGLVHSRRAPLDAELAPWLGDVLWIPPGDPSARLVTHYMIDTGATRRQVRWARRQRRAHRRFFDHAPRVPVVEARSLPQLRVPLGAGVDGSCVPQAMFGELTGEVCLFVDGASSELVMLLAGRELDRQEFDSPIAFAAMIDSPRLAPTDRYRGAQRDEDYARVERAMRAGVLRAVECLALAMIGGELPAGCVIGEPISIEAPDEALARIVRHGLALARTASVAIRPPLSAAPVWRELTGAWRSIDDLREHPAIGLTLPGLHVPSVPGRLQLYADRADADLIRRLLPDLHMVRYDQRARPDPELVAARLVQAGGVALRIVDAGLRGAIAPAVGVAAGGAAEPRLFLHHLGVALDQRPYTSHLVPCRIAIDSDAIVPDEDWHAALDDAGLAGRDFLAWETALVRAAALALVGDRPAELVGDGSTELASELGRTLCFALLRVEPIDLLGADLLHRLRAVPLVTVLGAATEVSVDELAAQHPKSIPYVAWSAVPVPTFRPMVGDPITARAIARLAGRSCHDGAVELELHRRAAVRAHRRAAHREKPQLPLELGTEGEHVPVIGMAPGVVGVGSGAMVIEVRVEGRPFQTIQRETTLPLVAIVELDPERTDPLFETVPDDVITLLVTAVRVQAPALLIAIANARPHALAVAGPERALLAAWLAPSPLAKEARDVLCNAPAFPTIQGGRISLEVACQPRRILSIATWQDPWLLPEGDPETSLDAPVIQVVDGSGELRGIIDELHRGAVVDVTDEAGKLQGQRRMARGLLPVPSVKAARADLKRHLADLGDLGRTFGHGEIGLVDTSASQGLLHAHGELVERVNLDVLPPIHFAIESPELISKPPSTAAEPDITAQLRALRLDTSKPHALSEPAQQLAIRLVREILRTPLVEELPEGIRRGLRRAVLAGRLAPADLVGIAVFETPERGWIAWPTLEHQLATFGDIWVISRNVRSAPLDDRRIVIRLDEADLALARAHGFAMIEATKELEMDAVARENRARPIAHTLEVPTNLALAQVTLDGDTRGTVAVLTLGAAEARGVKAHRAMHPFDLMPDPCRWPTLAVIDDARLEPNRTWGQPMADARWKAVTETIRAASERALATLAQPPRDALVVERIDGSSHHGLPSLRMTPRIQLRGALWLLRMSRETARSAVEIVHAYGVHHFIPDGELALGGWLVAYTPDGWPLATAMAELCGAKHGAMLRALIARKDVDPEVVAVHVARGLSLARILAIDAPKVGFRCFQPVRLDATNLVALLAGFGPVRVIDPGVKSDAIAVIDDGSELSRAVLAGLGGRAQRNLPDVPRPVAVPRLAIPPLPARAEPSEPPHPLRELVDVLRNRLAAIGITGPVWRIADTAEPMFQFDGALRVAGHSQRLRAVAAARLANSAWADAAIDALVAHALTVLNIALTEITDAAEAHGLGALLADS